MRSVANVPAMKATVSPSSSCNCIRVYGRRKLVTCSPEALAFSGSSPCSSSSLVDLPWSSFIAIGCVSTVTILDVFTSVSVGTNDCSGQQRRGGVKGHCSVAARPSCRRKLDAATSPPLCAVCDAPALPYLQGLAADGARHFLTATPRCQRWGGFQRLVSA